ncbi:nifR3 family TIM-barrel protein [Kineosporia succinea]|uniref:NifR3 family TIM-barrel protein n=1 Tax=Kineosporia succinea TaxID=84632 RepID=A0ABT9P5N8_9ACTN|nr:tRNA dihydrouridine synthase DusB [Kineosporia succinea]MDP9828007.1 nifR3 family TIM-barrel protein [Kineosporia succinea]
MTALQVGPHRVATPVVLAPMAGITNTAFRRLCREQMAAEGGEGLFVSEMVTSRALIERNDESMRLIQHDPDENPRSVQLYGVDPVTVGACVKMLLDENRADHIDLNFGCPVQKVTRKGGGAALPWKADLFRAIVSAAVKAATPHGVPVTVKMRKGIDADHLSYLDAGRIAEDEGVATVALHGRTAAEYYSGQADWSAIAKLKQAVTSIPVLGNGDIWSADDAVRMMAETGADGVVVGRGCLGRPWLFADLAAAMNGRSERLEPGLGYVLDTMRRHIQLLTEHYDGYEKPYKKTGHDAESNAENRACRDFRKHIAWYFKGYVVGKEIRTGLAMISSLAEFDELAGQLDGSQPYPGEGAEGPRGRAGSPRQVSLPAGWLDSREIDAEFTRVLREAELSVSGG